MVQKHRYTWQHQIAELFYQDCCLYSLKRVVLCLILNIFVW